MDSSDRDSLTIAIHQRLLDGDPTAPAELVEAYMDELLRRLRSRSQIYDMDDELRDSVIDALLVYAQEPGKYDPTKSGLLTYLTMSAYGDLLNLLARQKRRARRELPLDTVEKLPLSRNKWIEDIEDSFIESEGRLGPWERETLRKLLLEEFRDPTDRAILMLIVDGERNSEAYSALLGITDLDLDRQRRTVKRHKDRIKKRLIRLRSKLPFGSGNE